MENIKVPVSPGEVLDKITILEIKSERISDPEKAANVRAELALLQESWAENIKDSDVIKDLHARLKEINEALWEIEDDIRDKERAKEFDAQFIELARAVYVTNDQRSQVKKELNLHLGSEIIEEKSYQDYS
jgi:transcriptional regulator of nitric oxide reductase